MRFIEAKHHTIGGNLPIKRIVIHTGETPETLTTAEGMANYFARGEKVVSAHYTHDADSSVQCVKETDIAYHAPPNTGSIGHELSGRAAQTSSEWQDAYSQRMLREQVAPQVAYELRRHGVPPVWLTVADLQAGKRGVTSHANVSQAFKKSTHWDPGPNFPVDQFMELVRSHIAPPVMEVTMSEGYYELCADGGVFAYGVPFYGAPSKEIPLVLGRTAIGMKVTSSRKGYFVLASDGALFAYGDAVYQGSVNQVTTHAAAVGIY